MFTCMYAYQLAILVEVCVIVRHLMRRFIETATTIAIASHTVPVICVALFDVDCVPADIATHSADSSSNFVMEWRYTKYRQTLWAFHSNVWHPYRNCIMPACTTFCITVLLVLNI